MKINLHECHLACLSKSDFGFTTTFQTSDKNETLREQDSIVIWTDVVFSLILMVILCKLSRTRS